MKRVMPSLFPIVLALVLSAPEVATSAAKRFDPSPQAIDVPRWFKTSFLDFREDVAEAAKEGKRLIVYFGQDGCPYCRELMRVNFSQKDVVDKTRRHFDAVALNIWGDREVKWLDGKPYTEKSFAALLKVQFTPTLLFFDEKGGLVLRLNGYYPPHQFVTALDYVAGRHEKRVSYARFAAAHAREPSSGRLHAQTFFMKPPYDLHPSRKAGAKPLAVLFEQKDCAACDELHRSGFSDRNAAQLLRKFDVARLELFGRNAVVTPGGKASTAERWARELDISYTPSIVFFDAAGKEVFRVEAYLRPFHLAASLDYVASGAYRTQPSFQRYIQGRADEIRKAGGRIEIW